MAKSAAKRLKITLVKSLIGRLPKHKATADALGLRRMGQSVEIDNTPAMMGMVNQIIYLLKIEDVA